MSPDPLSRRWGLGTRLSTHTHMPIISDDHQQDKARAVLVVRHIFTPSWQQDRGTVITVWLAYMYIIQPLLMPGAFQENNHHPRK